MKMSIYEQALELYNNLPSGGKKLAAIKAETSQHYFNVLIQNPNTKPEHLSQLIDAMCEASKQITERVMSSNTQVQKIAKKLKKQIA